MRIEATRFADDTRNPSKLFFPSSGTTRKGVSSHNGAFCPAGATRLEEPFNGLDQRSKHSNKKKKQVRNRLALVELPPSAQPPPAHPPRSPLGSTVHRVLLPPSSPLCVPVFLLPPSRRTAAGTAAVCRCLPPISSPHLTSYPTPSPPTRLSCRPSGRDGRVPAGRRPASSALATSLRANTYFPRIPGQAEAPLGRRGPRGSGNSQVGRGGR